MPDPVLDQASATGAPASSAPREEAVTIDLAGDGAISDHDLLAAVEAELDEVERAMARLEDGTYGTCETCQGPIEPDRLAASPVTRTCSSHP